MPTPGPNPVTALLPASLIGSRNPASSPTILLPSHVNQSILSLLPFDRLSRCNASNSWRHELSQSPNTWRHVLFRGCHPQPASIPVYGRKHRPAAPVVPLRDEPSPFRDRCHRGPAGPHSLPVDAACWRCRFSHSLAVDQEPFQPALCHLVPGVHLFFGATGSARTIVRLEKVRFCRHFGHRTGIWSINHW